MLVDMILLVSSIVADVFAKFAGPCEAILATVKKWKTDYGEQFTYFQAQSDQISPLEKYRNKSVPTFLVFAKSVLVDVVRGVNTPYLEKVIKETMEAIKAGTPLQEYSESSLAKGQQQNVVNIAVTTQKEQPYAIPPPPEGQEYTLALIKPDALAKTYDIKDEIMASGFTIVKEKKFLFSKSQACEFYKEHVGKIFFTNLIQYVTSGPVLALILCKKDSVKSWRDLLGPTNARRAKDEFPNTLRAKFGHDGLRNGLHGSDSTTRAEEEWKFIFENGSIKSVQDNYSKRTGEHARLENTLLIIRPEVVGLSTLPPIQIASMTNLAPSRRGSISHLSSSHLPEMPVSETESSVLEKILYEILLSGLSVTNADQMVITRDQLQLLMETSVSDDDYSKWSAGNSALLIVSGDHAISETLNLVGPLKPMEAKEKNPNSLCAKFGVSDDRPGFYASPSTEKAKLAIKTFFPDAKLNSTVSQANLVETTFMIIKPDVFGTPKQQEILNKITAAGFTIKAKKEIQLTAELVKKLYRDHNDKPYFKELTEFMVKSPVELVILEKINAVIALRELIGPADVDKAKEIAPQSLRAQFGTDKLLNAVYGSDSLVRAQKDIDAFYYQKPIDYAELEDQKLSETIKSVESETKQLTKEPSLKKMASQTISDNKSSTSNLPNKSTTNLATKSTANLVNKPTSAKPSPLGKQTSTGSTNVLAKNEAVRAKLSTASLVKGSTASLKKETSTGAVKKPASSSTVKASTNSMSKK